MRPDLKVGVLGAGWAARQHCDSVMAIGGAQITAVFDVNQDDARTLAKDMAAQSVETLDALFSADIDLVIVSTPSGVHREGVVPALQDGKAVFVEKPISRTVEDAWAIVDEAERSGVVCAVGYQWRAQDNLGPLMADLQHAQPALMVSQGIGITQARPWFGDDRLSGGLIFERVSHHIDLQRMIAGEVSSVSAVRGGVALSGRADPSETSDDVLSLTLRFELGAIGIVTVGWAPEKYPPTQSLTVYTTKASFDLSLDPDFVLVDKSKEHPPSAAREHPFRRQMRSFLEAVRQGDQSLVHCSAREAAGTVAVAAAAASSLGHDGEARSI